jgi:hypothetical protein
MEGVSQLQLVGNHTGLSGQVRHVEIGTDPQIDISPLEVSHIGDVVIGDHQVFKTQGLR